MDKDLQTTIKELCEILEPMNIKLEKWLLENKKSFIGKPILRWAHYTKLKKEI